MTPRAIADLRSRIAWWWDEAARCRRIGALRLADFCVCKACELEELLP